jgi:hypothetical protein
MFFLVFKLSVSACLIAFASWLSGKRPELAGFIVALPLMTLLVLPFSQLEFQNTDNSVKFAQSIFVAIPLSMTFFLPFLLAGKLQLGFWGLYGSGLLCLIAAFFLHRWLLSLF